MVSKIMIRLVCCGVLEYSLSALTETTHLLSENQLVLSPHFHTILQWGSFSYSFFLARLLMEELGVISVIKGNRHILTWIRSHQPTNPLKRPGLALTTQSHN